MGVDFGWEQLFLVRKVVYSSVSLVVKFIPYYLGGFRYFLATYLYDTHKCKV